MKGRFLWLALAIASGVTILMWRETTRYQGPPPRTDVSVVMAAVGHLTGGHGCPSGFEQSSMVCEDASGFRIDMRFTCLATGESIRTRDVRDMWPRRKDFVVVRRCGNISIILWKPAQVAFGVRNLRIELMSRNPDKIIKLMCGESAKTTPGTSNAQTPEAVTPQGAEVATPPPTAEPK